MKIWRARQIKCKCLKSFNEPFPSVFFYPYFFFFFLKISQFFFLPFHLPRGGTRIWRNGRNDEDEGRGEEMFSIFFFFFFGCTLEIVAKPNRERDETWNVKLLSIVEIELRLDALGEPKDLIEWEKIFRWFEYRLKFLFPLFFIDARSLMFRWCFILGRCIKVL